MNNLDKKYLSQQMSLYNNNQAQNPSNQQSEELSFMDIQYDSSQYSQHQNHQFQILSKQDKQILQTTKRLQFNLNDSSKLKQQFSSTLSTVVNKFFTNIFNHLSGKAYQKFKQHQSLQQQSSNTPDNIHQNKKNIQNQIQSNYIQTNKTIAARKIKKINKQKSDQGQLLIKDMQIKYDFQLKNNRLYMKGMPKKPVSSFFFFFKQQSKKVQQINQNKQDNKQSTYGSVLAKCISQKWSSMTSEQKAPFEKLSQETRDKYKQQMDDFKFNNKEVYENFKKIKRIKANEARKKKNRRNQNGEIQQELQSDNQNNAQNQGNMIDQEEELQIMIPQQEPQSINNQKQQPKPYKGKFKSQHKPKSPVPSFFFFYNQKKQQIGKQNNVKTGAQIAKFASQIWKQMTQDQKRPYQQMAQGKRKQYYEQMKKFESDYPQEFALMMKNKKRKRSKNKAQNEEDVNSLSQQIGQIQSIKDLVKKQVGYKYHRPKAPVSSFFIFYKQNNSILSQKCKQQPLLKLAQYASEVWKKMSPKQKLPYEQRSNQSRKLYYKQMQQYRQKYPQELIQRKQDLKKKHKKQPTGSKKQRTQAKNQQSQQSEQLQVQAIQID